MNDMSLVSLLDLSPYQESFFNFYKARQPDFKGTLKSEMVN